MYIGVLAGVTIVLCAAAGLVPGSAGSDEGTLVPLSDPRVLVMGRTDRTDPARVRLGYPGITLRVRFEGPSLALRVATTGRSSFDVVIDDGDPITVRCDGDERDYVVAADLTPGPHTADIVRRNETWQGIAAVAGIRLGLGSQLLTPMPFPSRRLLFVGDSVTAGEGIDRTASCGSDSPRFANARLSYGLLLGRALDAQVQLVAAGGRGLTRDWQGKTDVLTAPQFFELAVPEDPPATPPRADLAAFVPDAIVVSLGTNDFSASAGPPPDHAAFVRAYVTFVRALRRHYPKAHVLLTEGAILADAADGSARPRTMLRAYIDEVVARIKDRRVHALRAEHYPGDACDAHPTRDQQRLMARDIEPGLRRTLGW